MDPVTIIAGALIAGATAGATDVASQAVKDAYAALKKLVVGRFGAQTGVEEAIASLEEKPNRKGRQEEVKDEVAESGAADDEEVLAQAQALLELLKQQGALSGAQYSAILTGSGAVAQGPGAAAAGKGGVAVSGNVTGGIRLGSAAEPDEDKE